MASANKVVRLAAMGDVHCSKTSRGGLQPIFAQAVEGADILALCGDLTDYGQPEEAHILAAELRSAVKIPIVGVLGNHDYESDKQDEVRKILCDAGVTLLDGESCEILGVGFAGIKGFAGGFGRGALGYWGERAIKHFVQEVLDEALKLETALARLRTPQRVAVLHYAPVRATVEGEPPEIFPYMGCSRLEDPLNRYPVAAVIHGHAHSGSPEGATSGGTPVYNVSMSLLQKRFPDQPPCRMIEIPMVPAEPEASAPDGKRRAARSASTETG